MKAQAEEYIEDLQLDEATGTGTGASSSGVNDGTGTVGPEAKEPAASHEAKDKSSGSEPPAKKHRRDDVKDAD